MNLFFYVRLIHLLVVTTLLHAERRCSTVNYNYYSQKESMEKRAAPLVAPGGGRVGKAGPPGPKVSILGKHKSTCKI